MWDIQGDCGGESGRDGEKEEVGGGVEGGGEENDQTKRGWERKIRGKGAKTISWTARRLHSSDRPVTAIMVYKKKRK